MNAPDAAGEAKSDVASRGAYAWSNIGGREMNGSIYVDTGRSYHGDLAILMEGGGVDIVSLKFEGYITMVGGWVVFLVGIWMENRCK